MREFQEKPLKPLYLSLECLLQQIFSDYESEKDADVCNESIKTGFHNLSINKGELIIVGARPGVGKSSLAYSLIRNIKVPAGIITTGNFFGKEVAFRLLSFESGVRFLRIKHGRLTIDETERIKHAVNVLKKWSVHISDLPNGRYEDISEVVSMMVMEQHVSLVFIDSYDYLKEIIDGQKKMSELLEKYKQLAVSLNVILMIGMDLPESGDRESAALINLEVFKKDVAVTRIVDLFMFLERNTDPENPEVSEARLIYGNAGYICEMPVRFRPESGRVDTE